MEKVILARPIPDLDKSICMPLLGLKGAKTPEHYVSMIEAFERKVEKKFIDLLKRMDINASVKTDPYSLPYKGEVLYTLNGESWMDGPYEYHRVFKHLVKEILNKGLERFRFYFYINIITEIPDDVKGINRLSASFGKIEYRLRYY